MRAVIQRVKRASVAVNDEIVSEIGPGLLCLIGIKDGDTEADADFIARKILNIRLWPSEKKAWDLSVSHQGFEILSVSQFTLLGRLKGNALDFSKAAKPQPARELYEGLLERLRKGYAEDKVKDGVFGAMMEVELLNDGPVTLIIDSARPNLATGASVGYSLDDL